MVKAIQRMGDGCCVSQLLRLIENSADYFICERLQFLFFNFKSFKFLINLLHVLFFLASVIASFIFDFFFIF